MGLLDLLPFNIGVKAGQKVGQKLGLKPAEITIEKTPKPAKGLMAFAPLAMEEPKSLFTKDKPTQVKEWLKKPVRSMWGYGDFVTWKEAGFIPKGKKPTDPYVDPQTGLGERKPYYEPRGKALARTGAGAAYLTYLGKQGLDALQQWRALRGARAIPAISKTGVPDISLKGRTPAQQGLILKADKVIRNLTAKGDPNALTTAAKNLNRFKLSREALNLWRGATSTEPGVAFGAGLPIPRIPENIISQFKLPLSAKTGNFAGLTPAVIDAVLNKVTPGGSSESVLQIKDEATQNVEYKTIPKNLYNEFKKRFDDVRDGTAISGHPIEGKVFHLSANPSSALTKGTATFTGIAQLSDIPTLPPKAGEPTKAPEVITDKAQIQEIKNSIAEGESILKSGRSVTGRKMSVDELNMVRRSIESEKAKIGIVDKKLPPHLQKLIDKRKGFVIKDVTPKGYGPEAPMLTPTQAPIVPPTPLVAPKKGIEALRPEVKEPVITPDKYEAHLERKRKLTTPIDISTEQGKEVLKSYETQKDIWFGKKDVRIFKVGTEKQQIQNKIKASLGEVKYTDKVKDYDKAIQLYIDTKRNPAHIEQYADKLTPEQTKLLELSQNLPPNIKVIADEIAESYRNLGLEALDQEVIRNVLDNYAARVWDIEGKKVTEVMRKFGTTTRHAKARKFETIIEGWANEFKLKIEGASNNLAILKEEIIKTIEDKKFIKALQKLRTVDGYPLLTTQQLEGYKRIEHSNFTMWKYAGKAEEGKAYGRNFFMDNEGNLFERRSLYAHESVAKNMNNILGVSKLNDIGWVKAITRFNADTKAWILQSSFFHHLAFMRSYWFGTQGKKWSEMSPRQAYRQGLEAIKQEDPIVVLGVKNGLTLGLKQDWNEELLKQRTKLGQMFDKMGIATTIRDKIFALRQQQADFLFGKFGAGLKAKAFLIEYRNMLRRHPGITEDARAKAVANLVNDDFGGLHLGRMGRNPTVQHIFRLFALAPDWTESNVRTMVKAFKAGGKEETGLYRKFWAGVFTKAMGLTVIANALMAGFDEDDEDAKGAWQRFLRNYKTMWKQGKLRYLDVDITPLYRALGGKTKERKYFTIIGHFKDPIKFILHPIRSAHHKGSVIYKFFHEALAGVDWASRRFTTAVEIIGRDIGKGLYKTTRKGKYRKGEPKWGKLKGKTVTWTPGEKGPLSYKQLPSFIINQIKGWQPIQIQNLLGWFAGEMEGFDALTKSMGLGTSTTYGLEKQEVKQQVKSWREPREKRELREPREKRELRGQPPQRGLRKFLWFLLFQQ